MDSKKASILLVEDDVNLGYLIKDYLEMMEYSVEWQEDGVKGINAFTASEKPFDLCILDIMMPFKDGFMLAQEIRTIDSQIPIIFLSAKDMKEDKIKGFKLGADDYITKPFSSEELILRIEAVLRRYKSKPTENVRKSIFYLGNFVFDYDNQVLTKDSSKRSLTKLEAEVLLLLAMNRNKLVRREEALIKIWGDDDYFKGRSMDVYITRLRKYFKDDPSVTISNAHGIGFKLEVAD